jgi:hypothetical protein
MRDPCLAKDGSVIHYTTMQPNQRQIAFFLPVGFVLLRRIRHSTCCWRKRQMQWIYPTENRLVSVVEKKWLEVCCLLSRNGGPTLVKWSVNASTFITIKFPSPT